MTEDAELLLRYARDRSEPAFVEIVHRHLDGIYSAVLRRVGNDSHLAEDVTQKVFAALARKAPSLTGHPFLTGWLYTAAKAEAANAVRGEQRRKHREQEAQAMSEPDRSSAAGADWGRLAPALDAAIDELPESDRQVVLLRFVNRRRYADIGAALQLSEDAARMRTNRALEQLRGILQRRGVVSTAAALEFVLAENAVGAVPAGVVTTVTNAALAGGAVATAGTAAVGTSLLGLLASPAALTVAVMAAAIGAAAHEDLAHSRQAAALARAQSELAALTVQVQAGEQKLAAETARRRPLAAAAPAGGPNAAAVARGNAFMARHPEVRAAFNASIDAQTRASYAQLFRDLGLSPDQIQQFEVLRRAGHGNSRLGPGGQMTLQSDGTQDFTQMEEQIHQLLGDAGYAQYRDFSQTQAARNAAAELVTVLAPGESPLTPAQSDQMTALYIANYHRGQFNWDAVASGARTVLSPAQLTVLGDLRTVDELSRNSP